MQPNPPPSPLTEASPNSLQELFDADPLQLNDDDISRIVQELRAQRERWLQGEAAGKGKRTKAQTVTVSLDDLGV
jgi:hypothetical protein